MTITKQTQQHDRIILNKLSPPAVQARGVLPFWRFCPDVLGVTLTIGQRVVAKVCVDRVELKDLTPDELRFAENIFNLDASSRIPRKARRTLCLRFGRRSGKTSFASWLAVYKAFTADVSKCGKGDLPTVAIIAPDKDTAKDLCLTMVKGVLESSEKLKGFIAASDDNSVTVRRPDGRRVVIKAYAADKGGKTVRGRSMICAILDEAEFFNSDPDGRFEIDDRSMYRAIKPALTPDGVIIFISTPWPSENLMTELMEKNWGKPSNALCAVATTVLMRPDRPDLIELIEEERQRDPENASREYDCDVSKTLSGTFFDAANLTAAIDEFMDDSHHPRYPVCAAADFGFKRDSSALAIVQWDGKRYKLIRLVEVIPTNGKPLIPSKVCEEFAKVIAEYGLKTVIADSFYREAIREMLREYSINIMDAPEGAKGKQEVYVRTKAMLDQGRLSIPQNARLLKQAREIVARPTPGGNLAIRSHRRTGQGHGDLVSAWTLAVHHLAYHQVKAVTSAPVKAKPGEEGYREYMTWLEEQKIIKMESQWLKKAESKNGGWRC